MSSRLALLLAGLGATIVLAVACQGPAGADGSPGTVGSHVEWVDANGGPFASVEILGRLMQVDANGLFWPIEFDGALVLDTASQGIGHHNLVYPTGNCSGPAFVSIEPTDIPGIANYYGDLHFRARPAVAVPTVTPFILGTFLSNGVCYTDPFPPTTVTGFVHSSDLIVAATTPIPLARPIRPEYVP